MKIKYFVALILIAIFGYYLRVMYLPNNSLTFGYDQARDLVYARQIVGGDIKIQGPPVSTNVLHHGVLWYYFLVIAVLIGQGNPVTAAYLSAFVNILVVFVIYYLVKVFTKDNRASLFAAFLYAISYESTQYATWVSNPTLAILFIPLTYFGLWMCTKTSNKFNYLYPGLTGISLGLMVQSNIFYIYHIIPIIIWLYLAKSRIKINTILILGMSLLFSSSSILLSEMKFGFKSISGLASIFSTQDSIMSSVKFGSLLTIILNQFGDVFAYNTFPNNIGLGGFFVSLLVFFSLRKIFQGNKYGKSINFFKWETLVVLWLFASLSVISFGGTSTPHLQAGAGSAVSILVGIYLSRLFQVRKILTIFLLLFIFYANINVITKNNPKGQVRFAIQKDMLLSNQLQAMDYTYKEAKGEKFSINSLTSPLNTNIVWAYLYNWYGLSTYGYLPCFAGPSQIGQIILLEENCDTDIRYLIIEPLDGIPQEQLTLKIGEEDVFSSTIEEKRFNSLVVQKRYKYD